ncbi:MAG: hypothetical protein KatS3mg105_3700 [Gemmatales bacterium]|nr:MAG: hypothetical protein KatS3mg105_3700 [Gemmatales bacterium]
MAVSFQQQSRIRKLAYTGCILVLITLTIILRTRVIEPQAAKLNLREEQLGEVDLTGSVVNLSLSGSRGLVTCYLWVLAAEKKKKHEWDDVLLITQSLAKLQTHYETPWKFMSWDIAYNISVELDRILDKYFYIARGVNLLYEGVMKNRDNPNLRFSMGEYYQHKIGIADENHTFRALFKLSCVDPRRWDPRRFHRLVRGHAVIDFAELEQFCRQHPHLVRLLRTIPGNPCDTPQKLISFLEDHRRIPSLYDEKALSDLEAQQTPLKPPAERFPIFPGPSRFDPTELTLHSTLRDDIGNFDAARAWYSFAQDPVIEKKRKPRLSLVIFQVYPARAQFYRAERLQEAGWFDEEGWTIGDWFPADPAKPHGPKRAVTVGGATPDELASGSIARWQNWSGEAWKKAFDMYERHGRTFGLIRTSPEQEALMSADTKSNRRVVNFDYFYFRSMVEQKRAAVSARKHFYRGEEHRKKGDQRLALAEYEHPQAFGPPASWFSQPTGWKKLYLEHPDFRAQSEIQRDTYEIQHRYLQLVEDVRGATFRWLAFLTPQMFPSPAPRMLSVALVPSSANLRRAIKLNLRGPFDGLDPQGRPLVDPEVKKRVLGMARLQGKP